MDYIFTNGYILNTSKQAYEANSVLTHNGKIAMIGTEHNCRMAASQAYEIIDLDGRLLLPGLVDSHTHYVELAKSDILVNLRNCYSLEDIRTYLINYRDNLSWNPAWILGDYWDRNRLSEPMKLNREFLDKIFPDKPVALMSKDYHSKLCNSLALKLAGINETTPDPYGGRIERCEKGIPTGVLYETAVALLDAYIVPLPEDIILQAIQNSVGKMHRQGLVGFHIMEKKHSRDLLLKASHLGSKFSLCWHFQVEELDYAATEGRKSYEGDDYYQTGGMKIFGDGSLGSRTAAMHAPYPGEPDNLGILRYTDAELYQLMSSAAENGFSSTIHAIGNRCVRQVIDTARKINTAFPDAQLMHRIEHVQSICTEDIPRLKASGLFASVQPLHLANDIPMIDAYWHDIEDQVYSFKSMLQAGVPLGFGSDAPIESINPFLGIYSAVERRFALNPNATIFRPDQVLSPIQAIIGYTLGAAQSSRMEHKRGSIEPGKLADLTVIDDYRQQPSTFWLNASSHLTMIAGEIVHSAI